MRLYYHILLLLLPMHAFAQKTVIDSLQDALVTAKNNQEKLQTLRLLSGRLSIVSFNQTLKLTEAGFKLAEQFNDSLAMAELNRYSGISYYFKGDYETATEFLFKAAGIYERKGKRSELAAVSNDLAKLYRKTGDLKRAQQWYSKAMELYQQLNDSSGVQMIYNESGLVFEYMGAYDEALRRYQASLRYAELMNDEMGKSWSYSFIAGVYVLQNKFLLAEDYNLRSLEIRKRQKDSFALALCYSGLGTLYSAWGKFDKAQFYLDKSIQLAELYGYKELLSNNYAGLSNLYNRTGNYKKAFDYFAWHTQLKDSLFSAQKTRQIEELSTIYETNKKEQQIQLQQLTIRKRNLQLVLIAGASLLLLITTFLLYKRYQWRQQAKMQQQLALQQQASIRAVLEAEENERTRIAKDLHDSVGQMLSAARMNVSALIQDIPPGNPSLIAQVQKIAELVDESCTEVRAVSHSMMPAALQRNNLLEALQTLITRTTNNKIEIQFHTEGIPQHINPTTSSILYRIIQECISNALKHAEASLIDIALYYEPDGISIKMEDDGKGFLANATDNGTGMGLQNIKARIEYLNGTLEFQSAPQKGTLIAIFIPLNK